MKSNYILVVLSPEYSQIRKDNDLQCELMDKFKVIDNPKDYLTTQIYPKAVRKGIFYELNKPIENDENEIIYSRRVNTETANEIADVVLLNVGKDYRELEEIFDSFGITLDEAMMLCIVKYECIVRYDMEKDLVDKTLGKYICNFGVGMRLGIRR